VAGFNLSLIFRKLLGAGTPREWINRGGALLLFLLGLFTRFQDRHRRPTSANARCREVRRAKPMPSSGSHPFRKIVTYTTGC
jgi:hypothetical protein